jgi:hypothetical protein
MLVLLGIRHSSKRETLIQDAYKLERPDLGVRRLAFMVQKRGSQ